MTTPTRAETTADWLARAAALEPRTELFIDGAFTPAASGRTFDDITGRDGSRIAAVAEGDAQDVDRAVAAARRSFDDRRWSDQPPAARKRVLLRLAELVLEHLEEIALRVRRGRHHGAVRGLQAVRVRSRQGSACPGGLHAAQDDLVRPVGRVSGR